MRSSDSETDHRVADLLERVSRDVDCVVLRVGSGAAVSETDFVRAVSIISRLVTTLETLLDR